MSKTIDYTQEQLNRMNIVGKFLAVRDSIPEQVDLVVLLGSSLISHLDMVSSMYQKGRFKQLMIVGGIGHSTRFLYENMNTFTPFNKYLDKTKSEADLYSNILTCFYQLPEKIIMVENKSTNCGNNAAFAYELYIEKGLKCKSVLLIQDPTMQRRSYASFLKEWKTDQIVLYNYAPIVPELMIDNKRRTCFKELVNPPWTVERYVELLMGEIPRLRDDVNGYGPKGAGFIPHVDIPDKVLEAYNYLEESNQGECLKRN